MSRYHSDGRMKAEYMQSPIEVYEVADGWIVENFVDGKEYHYSNEADALNCASHLEDGYMEEWDE